MAGAGITGGGHGDAVDWGWWQLGIANFFYGIHLKNLEQSLTVKLAINDKDQKLEVQGSKA